MIWKCCTSMNRKGSDYVLKSFFTLCTVWWLCVSYVHCVCWRMVASQLWLMDWDASTWLVFHSQASDSVSTLSLTHLNTPTPSCTHTNSDSVSSSPVTQTHTEMWKQYVTAHLTALSAAAHMHLHTYSHTHECCSVLGFVFPGWPLEENSLFQVVLSLQLSLRWIYKDHVWGWAHFTGQHSE